MTRSKSVEVAVSAVLILLAGLLLLAARMAHAEPGDQPAAALPPDTVAYLEITRPVDRIDSVATLAIWPEIAALCGSAGDHLARESIPTATVLRLLYRWPYDADSRDRLEALAGERIVVALQADSTGARPQPIVAFQTRRPHDQIEALAWWINRTHGGGVAPLSDSSFAIVDGVRRPFARACREGDWAVVGRLADPCRAARALAERRRGRDSLARQEAFRRLTANLPPDAWVRGFVNMPLLADILERSRPNGDVIRRLASALARRSSGMAFARRVSANSIDTWFAIQVDSAALFGADRPCLWPLGGAVASPPGALLIYELGSHLGCLASAARSLIREVSPETADTLAAHGKALTDATRVEVGRDLYPHLGNRLTVFLLPVKASADWSLPRPVLVTPTDSPGAVQTFLEHFFEWKAGGVAVATGGLVSATMRRENYRGVELIGLDGNSVVEMALPSPACAVIERRLVCSPSRSAVYEMIDHLQDPGSERAFTANSPRLGAAVEHLRADMPGLGRQLGSLGDRPGSMAGRGQSSPYAAPTAVLSAVARLMGGLGPLEATTTIEEGDIIRCHASIEIR
jgi:hypothetical protein